MAGRGRRQGALQDDNTYNSYKIHFEKDQFPPVNPKGFWSITLYDANNHLVDNSIKKYAIRSVDASHFVTNGDGSVDINIQYQAPGDEVTNTNNWLPAPEEGQFTVTLRMYWPTNDVILGISPWQMPAVLKY
jgi:hypothetical protein